MIGGGWRVRKSNRCRSYEGAIGGNLMVHVPTFSLGDHAIIFRIRSNRLIAPTEEMSFWRGLNRLRRCEREYFRLIPPRWIDLFRAISCRAVSNRLIVAFLFCVISYRAGDAVLYICTSVIIAFARARSFGTRFRFGGCSIFGRGALIEWDASLLVRCHDALGRCLEEGR